MQDLLTRLGYPQNVQFIKKIRNWIGVLPIMNYFTTIRCFCVGYLNLPA